MDLVISAPALIVLLPLLAGIALWVRWDSPGPALFRQERVGRGGKPFRIHKFRTMHELAPRVCVALGLQADALPLACVLEGGTWAAGRVLAQHLRGGTPPLSIASDGTVF